MEYATENSIQLPEAEKSYAISAGYPGLYLSLLTKSATDVTESIGEAKKFLTSTIFERQKIIQTLAKEPESIALYLRSIRTIALAGLRTSNDSSKQRWKRTLTEVAITEKQLSANVSTKLALLRLSISL